MIENREDFDQIQIDSHVDRSDGLAICGNCRLELGEGVDVGCDNCELDSLKRTVEALLEMARAADGADAVLMPYWMGSEFGEKPTDKQMYEAIADLNQAVAKIKAEARWMLED